MPATYEQAVLNVDVIETAAYFCKTRLGVSAIDRFDHIRTTDVERALNHMGISGHFKTEAQKQDTIDKYMAFIRMVAKVPVTNVPPYRRAPCPPFRPT